MLEKIGFSLIAIGLVFDILGCIGLIRFPDVYNRLQAATKCITMGTINILIGTFLVIGFTAAGMKILLCLFIILLICPTISHAIARASLKAQVPLWEKK